MDRVKGIHLAIKKKYDVVVYHYKLEVQPLLLVTVLRYIRAALSYNI